MLTISKQTQRRFILGKQGLWPGRRWQGMDGVRKALLSDSVIQVDPLTILARSHDLTLASRVLDYQPDMLNQVLYDDRMGFDWGEVLMVHPMDEIPYWQVMMKRRIEHPYWKSFKEQYQDAIDHVLKQIEKSGPVSGREFKHEKIDDHYWRSGKPSGRALYYLWTAGVLMTHHRKGFERYYDFSENIIPTNMQHFADLVETEEFLALRVFSDKGILLPIDFKNSWSGSIQRKVDAYKAGKKLSELIQRELVTEIMVEGDKSSSFMLNENTPAVIDIAGGKIPDGWEPLHTTTDDEVTFLAPLEIVSARGRAKGLFQFDYVWEVYKPAEQRKWGYYTIPILYQDRLVARMASRLNKKGNELIIEGFWVEDHLVIDEQFCAALKAGLERLIQFLNVEKISTDEGVVLPVSI
jgi:uncharacterized protein